MVAHPGHPWRRNQPCTGATAITTINAMNAGPINHAVAWMPATTTTAAAAPMRITKARGRAPRRGPAPFASGVDTAPTTPGPGTGVVMRRR